MDLSSEERYSVIFHLEKDALFQGTTFKAGSQVYLSEAGQIEKVVLGQDQIITDKSFAQTFPHVWKKGTTLIYKNIFADKPMPEIPRTIFTVADQSVFGYVLPNNCELSPSTMILTMGNKKEYEVSGIQVVCPTSFKIKGKEILSGKTIQIHSKDKVTQYNEKYQEIEI